jgi:hypothetical protein
MRALKQQAPCLIQSTASWQIPSTIKFLTARAVRCQASVLLNQVYPSITGRPAFSFGGFVKVRQGYIDDAGVGHILLTQGKEALVDAHWYHILSQHNWQAHKTREDSRWYAVRNPKVNGKHMMLSMARIVMGVTDSKIQVDHKDREATLDNREANLRVTVGQNQQNVGLRNDNASGFKGVAALRGKWMAIIHASNKTFYLGLFKTAVEAAAVYNFGAKRLHGEFAVLNDLSQVTEAQLEAA